MVIEGHGHRATTPCGLLSHADVQNPGVGDWPIIWCPNAAYHEQDNIRRAQGEEPHQL